MSDFKGYTWHKFWLKSGRGSDMSEFMFLHPDLDPAQELEYWTQRRGGHLTSIEYGRTKLRVPPQGVMKNMITQTRIRAEQLTALLKEYERILCETYGEPDD